MSVWVIGVDPGDSTGVAVLRDVELLHALQGPPATALDLVELVLSRVTTDDQATVACERFVQVNTQRHHSHQPTAQRVVGAVEALAARYHVNFVSAGPADAWAIASNALLRQLSLYQSKHDVGRSDAVDANMAVRHALLTLATRHASLFDQLLRANNAS